MFANTFQSGFVSVFYSVGSNPLQLWDKQVKNGHIRRVVDDEVRSLVLEIAGTNVATTYITCPIKPRLSLGIKLPFLVLIIKNMKKYFTFEIQILDDKDMHRRFRVSNFQSTTKVRPFCTTMPIGLSSGWNQVQFNLADFTKRAYGSTYIETTRIQVHANVRIRRLYFCDMLYTDDEIPNEYKLFLPTPGALGKKGVKKEAEPPQPEKRDSKKTSTDEMKIQIVEGEIPSGAPPSPALPTPAPPEGMEPLDTSAAASDQAVPSEASPEAQQSPEGEAPPAESEPEIPVAETIDEPLVEGAEITGEAEKPPEGDAPTEGVPEAGEAGATPADEGAPPEAPAEPAPPAEEAAASEVPPADAAVPEEAPPE